MKFAHFSHVWNKPEMTPAQRYQQLWREVELADELDFDYGFAVEHHFTPRESWMSAPSIYCVAAGARTRRIRLGPMGYVVPLHHPLRLAEEIAIVDQTIEGRLELGLVPGITPGNFGPYQANYEVRRERTLEFVELLKAVYTQGKSFDFEGRFHQFHNLKLSLNPAQMPHPPLWIETRDPATLEFCARNHINSGYFMFLPREDAYPRYVEYLRQWKQAGWPDTPKIAYWTLVYVDETDDRALAVAGPNATQSFGNLFGFEGRDLQREMRERAEFFEKRGEPGAAEIVTNMLNPDYLLGRKLILAGSPQTVASQLKEAAIDGHFNTFFGEFNFGALKEDDLQRSIRLFGTEVIPQLRNFEPF